jgi:hypothetical protein
MITFKKTSGTLLLLALMADYFGDKPEYATDEEELPKINFNDIYNAWIGYKKAVFKEKLSRMLPTASQKNSTTIPPIMQCFTEGRTPEQVAAATVYLQINYGAFLENPEVAMLSRQLFTETVPGTGVYRGSADEIVKEGSILMKAVNYFETERQRLVDLANSLAVDDVEYEEDGGDKTSPIPPVTEEKPVQNLGGLQPEPVTEEKPVQPEAVKQEDITAAGGKDENAGGGDGGGDNAGGSGDENNAGNGE